MPRADININVRANIDEIVDLNYERVIRRIDYMAEDDIMKAIRKSDKYKKFVKDSTTKALEQITTEGVYSINFVKHDVIAHREEA